jgi:hypothetical protein
MTLDVHARGWSQSQGSSNVADSISSIYKEGAYLLDKREWRGIKSKTTSDYFTYSFLFHVSCAYL